MRYVWATLAVLAISACTPTSTTTTVGVDPSITDDTRGSTPLAASEAARLFGEICGGSLPNFVGAQRRMTAAGFSIVASTGTQFHTTYDASMRILDGPGVGQSCSLVFVSSANPASVNRTLEAALGPIVESPLGAAIAYPDGRAVTLVADPRRAGGQTYYNLRMWSER